jgi:hypothetical protein
MTNERTDAVRARLMDETIETALSVAAGARVQLRNGNHLAALERAHTLRMLAEQIENDSVARARAWGHSWPEVAAVLQISRQAAWQRFRNVAGR